MRHRKHQRILRIHKYRPIECVNIIERIVYKENQWN